MTYSRPRRATSDEPRKAKEDNSKSRREIAKRRDDKDEHFIEFISSHTVNLKDDTHRKLGLWAFDTANGNAWAGARETLAESSADFVAVQEAKVSLDDVPDTEATARGQGWNVSIAPCLYADGGESQLEWRCAAATMWAWGWHVMKLTCRRS